MSLNRHFFALPRHSHLDLRQFFGPANGESAPAAPRWVPQVDIKEEPERFVIFADLPGVDPNSIDVQMDKGVLTIRGERSAVASEEGSHYSRTERAQGVFTRRFSLPESANPDAITAVGKHGVLEITLPKRPEVTPRRIQVQ